MDIHVSPQIERLIRDALDEDIGAGDLATMATISADSRGTGLFRAKKEGVVAGLVLLDRIFYFIDHRVVVRLLSKDGADVRQGTVVAEAIGPGITKKDCAMVVDGFLNAVKKALATGDNIEIRGFGTFKVRRRKTRMARNPRTGDPVKVPMRAVPVFKPSKHLRNRVARVESPRPE